MWEEKRERQVNEVYYLVDKVKISVETALCCPMCLHLGVTWPGIGHNLELGSINARPS